MKTNLNNTGLFATWPLHKSSNVIKASCLTIVASLLAVGAAFAQNSFVPKNFGPAVNSEYSEINPVISPDGKMLYFSRVNHPDNTFGEYDSEDVWFSKQLNDTTWSQAARIPNLNIGRYNAVMSVGADGQSVLLNGVFNKKGNIWKKRGLSVAYNRFDIWMTPERLKVKRFSRINRGLKSSGSMASDGNSILLSFSRKFNGKKNNLYVCEKKANGTWGRPKSLKALNTRRNEDSPFLSADGKTIFFASDRDEKGQFDIYKATRKGKEWNEWSEPVRMTDTINTTGGEAYFKTNKKGSNAYFSSTTNSAGKADIFSVKVFEENPFVIVSGRVYNTKTNRPLLGKKFKVLVNGKPADSVKINEVSASYTLKLKLGQSYSLSPVVAGYVAMPSLVDVSQTREFTRSKVDLQAAPIPYVLVKGKLLIEGTNLTIASVYNPTVVISTIPSDSIKVDIRNSTYEARVNHGAVYNMRAEATKHEAVPQKLDLSKISEYQEISQDLFLSEKKMAIVAGKILDKNTNRPLARLSAARINVEGLPNVLAKIDTLTGQYELKLPLESTYTINASAPNYYPFSEAVSTNGGKTELRIYKDLLIIPITPIAVGQAIRLNNISFDPAKAVLKSGSFSELDRVAKFLLESPKLKIEIAGHTDNVGNPASNKKLSLNRAKAVADYLVNKGIARYRVVAKGYGSSKPLKSNKTKEGKTENRRVEFTILRN